MGWFRAPLVEARGIVYPDAVEGTPVREAVLASRYEWLSPCRGRHGGPTSRT
jgi:hypothetical protein